ncbi:hypothetical protein JTE90_028923 [Oedothorax gibbosus]|uniref:BTB domain-containing protein n=1 Tax=Oedothorax gibbosus TaxID=931172 RepID=A0AAV6VJ60_9ARAC|nr:hypothetical protein JTE90_028923 [Oedothorax gibbosus]
MQSTTISIPPFSGVYWCLRLKLCEPGNLKSLECYLHRIPSEPGPDFIFVDFTLKVSGSTVRSRSESFKDVQFLNVEPYPQANSGLKLKLEVSKFPSLHAKLLVECEIYRQNVQHNYTTGFYHANSQTLYEDMLALRANRNFSDVILCVQSRVFFTHKAILDARLPLVSSILNINYTTQSEIEVFNISPSLIESLVHYAYSGCLVAGTFAELQQLHKIAGKLQLVDLQRLINTSANNCLARTSMNIQRKVVKWDMDPRISWINGHDMIAIIIPHNIGSAQTLTVSWGAVDTPTGKFLEFKFQFPSLLDERPIFMDCSFTAVIKDSVFLRGKFHNLFSSRTPWFTGPLVSRSLLDKHHTLMTLRFEINLCDGEGKSSIVESEAEIVFPMPPCKNLEKLSYDLKNLFATGRFSDVTLVTDQHMEIRSHRAILATRSKTFLALLRQCALPGNKLTVNGVSNEALLFVLHYIYTGKIKDLNLTNVQEFNEAAIYFQLPALVSETHFFMDPSEQSHENRFQAFV